MAEDSQKNVPRMPAGVERDLSDFQSLQRQLQNVLIQKQQMQIGLEEVKSALASVEETTGDVYKAAGGLLLSTTKENAKKELAEKKEMFELRISQISKQETALSAKLTDLKGKIESAAKKMQGGS
ncbi:MAG: prefoldin subunit beta [Candidatus Micrarchaeia archaeon]